MNAFIPILQGLLFSSIQGAAYRLSLERIKIPPSLQQRDTTTPQNSSSNGNANNTLTLTGVQDLLYLVNLNVGGHDYPVQLDTGSSDVWIKNNSSAPLPGVTTTSTPLNLTYAAGWAAGYISYAPITLAGLSSPNQAFLEATTINSSAVSYGARGIVGLGFTSLSSIDAQGNETHSSSDRSLLYNLFQVNPSEPNFIRFILQQNGSDGSQGSSFSIGKYEAGYEQIASQAAIPTWPVESPTRWTVLLDSIIVGDNIIVPSTSVPDAPTNKAVALLDSGSSYAYGPKETVDAIYSNVTGAEFNNGLNQWVVPCSYEIDMALQFGGQIFPFNPLDVSMPVPGDPSMCVGSFIPGSFSTESGQFDMLIGDNFLRSVYAIYDFGNFDSKGATGNPFMQMLSIIDPDKASVQFHNERGGSPNTNITYVGLSGTAIEPVYGLSQNVTNSLETISKLVPVMLAVVAFNALVLVVLVIGGIIYLCRRRRRKNPRARPNRGRTSPMPMNPVNSYIAGVDPPQQSHRYEPVSMALTEDTLYGPPSPAFHKFDGSPGGSMDRPKSYA